MNLNTRLELILHGYNDNSIGALAYVLGNRFKITESKIKELLEISEDGSDVESRLLRKTIQVLTKHTQVKPKISTIIKILHEVITMLGLEHLATRERLFKLGNYMNRHWDELLIHLTDLQDNEEPENPDQLFQQLASVPNIKQ